MSYEQKNSAPWFGLASICMALFLVPLTMTSVNIALPVIAIETEADAVMVGWVATLLLMSNMVTILPAARVADIIGRKKVFQIGIWLFSLVSVQAVWIDTIEQLLLLRIGQGFATAMLFGTGMAIVSSIFANANRGMALGLVATSIYLGMTCGPAIGGWLTESLGWRSVFWAPVPFAVMASVLVMINIKGDYKAEGEQKLDWVGSLLCIVCIGSFFIGLSGLPDLISVLCLLLSAVVFYLFCRQQETTAYPLIRFSRVVKNKVFTRSITSSLFMYGANYPLMFVMSLYLQYIQGMSPSEAGHLVLIQALLMACIAPFSGRLSDHYEPRVISTIGCLFCCSGFAMMVWINSETNTLYIMSALALHGVGFGLFSSPNNNAALGSVPSDRLSIGSAMLNLSRSMGNMVGMTVVVLVMNQVLGSQAITPDNYSGLMDVIKISFGIGGAYTLIAAYNSYQRGNVHT